MIHQKEDVLLPSFKVRQLFIKVHKAYHTHKKGKILQTTTQLIFVDLIAPDTTLSKDI